MIKTTLVELSLYTFLGVYYKWMKWKMEEVIHSLLMVLVLYFDDIVIDLLKGLTTFV